MLSFLSMEAQDVSNKQKHYLSGIQFFLMQGASLFQKVKEGS